MGGVKNSTSMKKELVGDRHGKVHGAERADEVLQLLTRYTPLSIRYIQKGDELEAFLGRQGEGTAVGVDLPSHDLLDDCLVPVPYQFLLQAGGVLHLTRKGGEISLKARMVSSETLCCWVGFSCEEQNRSSI